VNSEFNEQPILKFKYLSNPVFWLFLIFLTGLIMRIFYFPYEIPIKNDGFFPFVYAFKILETGGIPHNIITTNTGWAYLLSGIFSVTNSSGMMESMHLTRITSMIISSVTIFPVFLILNKFFSQKTSLIGAALFIFEPRLIQMSTSGISYDLFLLLILSSIALFFSDSKKSVFIVFPIIAFATIVRYEALLMTIPFSIAFFYKLKNENKRILKFALCLLLFCLIIIPISIIRTDSNENCRFICDGIFENFFGNSVLVLDFYVQEKEIQEEPRTSKIPPPAGERQSFSPDTDYLDEKQSKFFGFLSSAFEKLIRYLLTNLFPYFVFVVPIGIFIMFKRWERKLNYKITTLIIFSIIIVVPALYAYGRNIQDPRYLFVLFPIYSLISLYCVELIFKKISRHDLIILFFIIGIICASLIFLENERVDEDSHREAFLISKKVLGITSSINEYEYGGYVKVAELERDWPELPLVNERGKLSMLTKKFVLTEIDSLDELIKESEKVNLRHLLIFKNDKNELLRTIFDEYDKYENFKIIYNSKDDGFKNEFVILELVPFDGIRKLDS